MAEQQRQDSLWSPEGDAAPASEDEVLALIDGLFPSKTPHTPLGRGHDCAELGNLDGKLALSTDMFWQDSHFRTGYFTPAEAGAKALSVAVSDLAAAGAVPLGFSLDLLLPSWLGRQALRDVLAGMAERAREFGIVLAGGDLTGGERLGFSLTVWGAPVEPEAPFLRRGQARPGDKVFIIGESGLALVGLLALERRGRAAIADWPRSCAAFLVPEPLLAQGQALARLLHDMTRGMRGREGPRLCLMDLSDGLARDLPRLSGGSGVILEPDEADIPVEVRIAAPILGRSAEELFLLGGEDYALLGSCAESAWPLVREAVPGARALGRVRSEKGIVFGGAPVSFAGFDHFASTGGGTADGTSRQANPQRQNAALLLRNTGREAWRAGLMAGYNGNISCRAPLDSGADGCLITRSGAAKSRLEDSDFALLDLAGGRHVSGPMASTESVLHIGIYRNCPDSEIILHTHPPRLLALSLALPREQRLLLPLPEAERYRAMMAWTPYFPPGSPELAEAVAEAARTHPAVWMERHGLVVHGKDAAFVLSLSEELEQLALVQLAQRGVPETG